MWTTSSRGPSARASNWSVAGLRRRGAGASRRARPWARCVVLGALARTWPQSGASTVGRCPFEVTATVAGACAERGCRTSWRMCVGPWPTWRLGQSCWLGTPSRASCAGCHGRTAADEGRGPVFLSSIPSGPALSSVAAVATRHPVQAMRWMAGRPMRLSKRLLFADSGDHQAQMKRLVADSPRAQYQLLFHRMAEIPDTPVLVVGGTNDALVPLRTQMRTARRASTSAAASTPSRGLRRRQGRVERHPPCALTCLPHSSTSGSCPLIESIKETLRCPKP